MYIYNRYIYVYIHIHMHTYTCMYISYIYLGCIAANLRNVRNVRLYICMYIYIYIHVRLLCNLSVCLVPKSTGNNCPNMPERAQQPIMLHTVGVRCTRDGLWALTVRLELLWRDLKYGAPGVTKHQLTARSIYVLNSVACSDMY